jgi:hypothetical protein
MWLPPLTAGESHPCDAGSALFRSGCSYGWNLVKSKPKERLGDVSELKNRNVPFFHTQVDKKQQYINVENAEQDENSILSYY